MLQVKELWSSSHLINEFGDKSSVMTADGSFCTTWLKNLNKPIVSLIFSQESETRSNSGVFQFSAQPSSISRSVLQVVGSSNLVRAGSWEMYGSAALAQINALVFATCFAKSSSSSDTALAYSKLIQHLAVYKRYKGIKSIIIGLQNSGLFSSEMTTRVQSWHLNSDRAVLWVEGRKNKEGEYGGDELQDKISKIVPKQPDLKQCGFFVLQYMRCIFEFEGSVDMDSMQSLFTEKTYSKDQIDEMRVISNLVKALGIIKSLGLNSEQTWFGATLIFRVDIRVVADLVRSNSDFQSGCRPRSSSGTAQEENVQEVQFQGCGSRCFLDMSTDDLVKLLSARARRRFQRGLKRKPMALIKKAREAPVGEKPALVRTHLRNMIIVPEMIGSVLGVYNGKTFNPVEIKPEMIGHYLSELSISYKPVKHGRPGISATHSSRFIPLK
ncbi:hypothetical protein ACS0TY_030855 [Phlomoides rotata]